MKFSYFLIIPALVSIVAFGVLSKYEDRAYMRNLDFSLTVKVQERIDTSSHLRASAFVGNLMEGATFFASPLFTVVVTLLLTWQFVYDRKKRRWYVRALVIPVALVMIVMLEIYGKSIVHHPSPPFSMIKHPTTIFPADYINDQFSYPSGHAARALFMAALTGLWILREKYFHKRTLVIPLFLLVGYVMLVSISRIYLGHHWLSDVVGGWLLGSFGIFMCASYLIIVKHE